MPRFAASLTMLFTELPFLARFDAARRVWFQGVEFLFPYDHDADEIRRALDDCSLPLILFNTPAGDWAMGERCHAAMPEYVIVGIYGAVPRRPATGTLLF